MKMKMVASQLGVEMSKTRDSPVEIIVQLTCKTLFQHTCWSAHMSHDNICSSNVFVLRANGTMLAVGAPTDFSLSLLFFVQFWCKGACTEKFVTQ